MYFKIQFPWNSFTYLKCIIILYNIFLHYIYTCICNVKAKPTWDESVGKSSDWEWLWWCSNTVCFKALAEWNVLLQFEPDRCDSTAFCTNSITRSSQRKCTCQQKHVKVSSTFVVVVWFWWYLSVNVVNDKKDYHISKSFFEVLTFKKILKCYLQILMKHQYN